MDGGSGLSRRQFLLVGGGGGALLWAGRTALVHVASDGVVAAGPVDRIGPTTSPALRSLPFSDTFANDALPEWNVRRPVAILGTTPFGFAYPANQALDHPDVLRGRGVVVGLDGPMAGSSTPGLLETVDSFVFDAGGTYTLSFSVAGSQLRSDSMPPSTIIASLPGLGVAKQITRMPSDDFLEFSLEVPVTGPAISTIVIASGDTPGHAGVLLENVSLTRAQ